MISSAAIQPSSADLTAFARDGFHIARGLIASPDVDALRDAAMAQVSLGTVAGLYDEYHCVGADDPLRTFRRMLMPHVHDGLEIGRLAQRLLFDARLQPFLRAFLDDEPAAAQSMFYFKPAGARGQDLHQDDFYLRSAPRPCLAAWMAVDPIDDENGGLRLVVGSHRLPLLPTRQADLATSFTDDGVDAPAGMTVVAPELVPGDVLFFGGTVIHGSGPNRSRDRFRRSFIAHYVGASTTQLNPWNRPVRTFDRRVLTVPEAPVGPWQDSFAARTQRTQIH